MLHLQTFFWQLDSLAIQWWQYAGIVGGMVGIPFTPFFNRVFDKKWSVILGVVVCVLGATGPVMLALAGLMPTSYMLLVPLLVAFAFLSEFAIEPVGVSVASMMGDMADEHELRVGSRQEGVYFAAFNFAGKCSGAIGPLVAGIAIDIVGLDPNSTPGEVPAQVLFDFGLVYAALVYCLGINWTVRTAFGARTVGRGARMCRHKNKHLRRSSRHASLTRNVTLFCETAH